MSDGDVGDRRLESECDEASSSSSSSSFAARWRAAFSQRDALATRRLQAALGGFLALHFVVLRPLRLAEHPAAAAAVACTAAARAALRAVLFCAPPPTAPRPEGAARLVFSALRSTACSLANCLLPPLAARWARAAVVFVGLLAAQGDGVSNGVAPRPGCSPGLRKLRQLVLEVAEVAAVSVCLFDATRLGPLDPLVVVEGAAFLSVLRDSDVGAPARRFLSTLLLCYALALRGFVAGPPGTEALAAVLPWLARRAGVGRRVLWAGFATADGLDALSLVAVFGAVCALAQAWRVAVEVAAAFRFPGEAPP